MKKILLIIITISLFSCEKEEIKIRNYTYPADNNNPTGLQIGAAIHVYEGETDEDLIKRIREFEYYGKDFSDTNKFPYIFPTKYPFLVDLQLAYNSFSFHLISFPHPVK